MFIPKEQTQASELTGAGHRALFTRSIPSTADVVGAAAHLFCHVEGQLSIAGPVVWVKVPVAIALPHVFVRIRRNKNNQMWVWHQRSETFFPLLWSIQTHPCNCGRHWPACSQWGRCRCSCRWCCSTGQGRRFPVVRTRWYLHPKTERKCYCMCLVCTCWNT